MNYSLINVTHREGDTVSGYWLQDCSGTTLDEAKKRAKDTEKANNNHISVAVTQPVNSVVPLLDYFVNLKAL